MDTKKPVRRALLKGALAAPAVLTVRTASATATGSSLLCIARDAHNATTPPTAAEITAVYSDNWMRRTLTTYTLQDSGTKNAIPGKYYLGTDGAFWKLNEADPLRITAVRSSYTPTNAIHAPTSDVRYTLEYYDSLGNKTGGYAYERRGGNALTRSCHSSFRAVKA